jgi:uridine kinase
MLTRINTDDYYYDRSEEVKKAGGMANFAKNYDFDVPEAFELGLLNNHIELLSRGQSIWLPKYDMSGTAKREDRHSYAVPGKIIVAEGLYTLSPRVKNAFNFKIYVDVTQEVQKSRWYKRAEERGLGAAADKIYQNALDKAQIHVKPTSQHADIVLNGEANRERYKSFTRKILDVAEANCLSLTY